MAADTCNGAEGGEKAPPPPPPPPSLISPHSKVMPISPIWVDGIITKEGKRRKSFRLLDLICLRLEASGTIWVAAMSHDNARFSIGSHFDARWAVVRSGCSHSPDLRGPPIHLAPVRPLAQMGARPEHEGHALKMDGFRA